MCECVEHRTMPLYHEALSSAVRHSQLGSVWTPERALHYLLVGGAVVEAVWLLRALGDWKAAFILATGCLHHQHMLPQLYTRWRDLHPVASVSVTLR